MTKFLDFGENLVLQQKSSSLDAGVTFSLEPGDFSTHSQCPVCGSGALNDSERIKFRGAVIRYSRCGNCELMFMNPMPSQDWYNRFYAQEFWEGKADDSGGETAKLQEEQALKELRRAQNLYRFLSGAHGLPERGARILEIGCAFGLIGRTIADRIDGTALGVEPSDSARAFAKKHVGVDVVARNIDELAQWEPGQPVDLAIFCHVLENIVDPLKALSQVRRVLRDRGMLLIETPNPVFQRSVSIYHPFVYSARSIKHLVARAGFSIVGYESNGLPVNSVIPRFQRLLAVKSDGAADDLAPPKPGLIPFALRRRVGLSFWKFGKRFRREAEIDDVGHRVLKEVSKSAQAQG